LKFKPDINISALDEYAFRMSCEHGHFNIILFLLKSKPNINISINSDDSFSLACENGHLEIAKFLLGFKPDIDISAKNNKAFKFSCINGHYKTGHFLASIKPELYHIESDESGKIINFYIKKILPITKIIRLNKTTETECPICYSNDPNIQTNCGHNFCEKCIQTLITRSNTRSKSPENYNYNYDNYDNNDNNDPNDPNNPNNPNNPNINCPYCRTNITEYYRIISKN
jgi:hypothetical protein